MAGAVVAVTAGQPADARPATTPCNAIDISAGRNLTLNVSSVYVAEGGCVRFANLTDVTVTVRVSGSSFSTRLPARTPAAASRSYTATKSADVIASDGVRSGRGRINVSAAPSTSATPTPTQSQIAPPVKPTTTPTPTPSKSKGSGGTRGLHEAPLPGGVTTDAAAAVNTQHQFALPAIPSLPPEQVGSGSGAVGGTPTVSHPVVAPQIKSTDPKYTSTTLDPTSGPRRGLPAAVAAVLLLGLAAAYGRTVLVAGEAVERRPTHRPVRRTV
jgi:hypothetical protein